MGRRTFLNSATAGAALQKGEVDCGGIGDEFGDGTTLSVFSGGTKLDIEDNPFRTFAAVSLDVNCLSRGALSGFLRLDGLFASNATGGAIRGGVRLTQ